MLDSEEKLKNVAIYVKEKSKKNKRVTVECRPIERGEYIEEKSWKMMEMSKYIYIFEDR